MAQDLCLFVLLMLPFAGLFVLTVGFSIFFKLKKKRKIKIKLFDKISNQNQA